MQKRRMRGSCCRAPVVAVVMATLGLLATISGTASASVPPNAFPTIRFWSAQNEVTLQVPTPACPASRPSCEWTLFVNEPDVPAQTMVGAVSGTSGILTVAYPADFCGVIQADAILGPSPVRLEVGHQRAVTTAPDCPPITTTPTPKPNPGASGDGPPSPTGTGTSTGTSTGTPTLTNVIAHPASADAAQLPFTGIDIKPMGYIGVAMVVAGLLLLCTLEKRRRALQHVARVSRWLVGE